MIQGGSCLPMGGRQGFLPWPDITMRGWGWPGWEQAQVPRPWDYNPHPPH